MLTADAGPDFGLAVSEEAGRLVVEVSGELDVATSPLLRAAVAELADRDLPIVLDTAAVSFMDSTGLGALLTLRRDPTVGTRLVLRRPSDAVRRVLDLTRTDGLFEIEG